MKKLRFVDNVLVPSNNNEIQTTYTSDLGMRSFELKNIAATNTKGIVAKSDNHSWVSLNGNSESRVSKHGVNANKQKNMSHNLTNTKVISGMFKCKICK